MDRRRSIIVAVIVLLLELVSARAVFAAALESVDIPLERSDARFGHFYVKKLGSLLVQASCKGPTPAIIFLHGCGGIGGRGLATAESDADHFASLGTRP